MGILRNTTLAIVLSSALVGPAWAGSAAEDIPGIAKAFAAAFNSGDGAGVASLYSENAVLLPPGGKRVDGRAAIQAFWQGAIDGGLGNLALTTVEIEESGDLAYEVGGLAFDAPGEGGAKTRAEGKFIVVWKKNGDGTWQLHKDIWNMGAAK